MRRIRRRAPDEKESTSRKQLISDAIIVAAVPALAYALAFSYELGYARYFAIPAEFIGLNTWTVILVAFTIPAVLLPALLIINFAHPFLIILWKIKHPVGLTIIRAAVPLVLFVSLAIALHSQRRLLLALCLLPVWYAVNELLFPLIQYKTQRTYAAKVRAAQQDDDIVGFLADTLVGHGVRLFGPLRSLCVLFIPLTLVVSYGAGQEVANRQAEFLVLSQPASHVVLRIYGETMLLARYDGKAKKVYPEFQLIKAGDSPAPELKLQKIGPLRPVKR